MNNNNNNILMQIFIFLEWNSNNFPRKDVECLQGQYWTRLQPIYLLSITKGGIEVCNRYMALNLQSGGDGKKKNE